MRTSLQPTGQRGVALPSVLWALAGLMLMIGSFSLFARVEIRLTAALVGQAQADTLMKGGVEYIKAILEGAPGLPQPPAPRHIVVQIDNSRLDMVLTNAAGLINLNQAPRQLLADLFTYGLGLNNETIAILLQGLRPETVGNAPPPPLRDVRELRGMRGMDESIYNALINYVTVGSRQAGVNVRLAPVNVLTVLAHGDGDLAQQFAEARATQGPLADLTMLQTPYHVENADNYYHLDITVTLPSGQRYRHLYWIERKGVKWRVAAHTPMTAPSSSNNPLSP